jgi:membrane-associated phospholipid phosphatase
VVVALFTPELRVWRVVAEWVPFGLVFIAYDYSRGAAETLGMPVHVTPQITMDRWLGFGTVPTVWLQQHLLSRNRVHAWQVIPSAAYLSHFIVPYVVAAWLWARDHDRFVGYTERFVLLSFLGVATYILLPWAPPWMASSRGLLPPLSRSVNDGWYYVHVHFADQVFHEGQGAFNLQAALPSLHAAYTMMIAIFFWKRSRWWTRVVLVAYPLSMGFSLVFGAEHYVVDILLGWLYALLVHLGCLWLDRWHERRRGPSRAAVEPAVAA